MEYVNLGSTGLRVSRICLGMMSFGDKGSRQWVLEEDAAEPLVRAAADGGVGDAAGGGGAGAAAERRGDGQPAAGHDARLPLSAT